jgi:predicted nucleic acid-binding protein
VTAPSVLVDTDVLIWHLRGHAQATRRLDQLGALTDALIAATAIRHRHAVLTANVRHFAVVAGLSVEPFTP